MFMEHGRLMAEITTKLLEEAAKERMDLLLEHNQVVARSKVILDKVQTTYQTRIMDYEVQATTMTMLIKQLKKEKEATEDKVKMGIKRIWMIIEGRREWMRSEVKDRSATVWN